MLTVSGLPPLEWMLTCTNLPHLVDMFCGVCLACPLSVVDIGWCHYTAVAVSSGHSVKVIVNGYDTD